MKFLCIADIHGAVDEVRKAAEYAKDRGLENIIIVGDFPGHGTFRSLDLSLKDAEESLKALEGFRVHAIPGNCDPVSVRDLLDRTKTNFHCRAVDAGEYVLVGFGGSNITPFETPFEFEEDDIYRQLSAVMEEVKRKKVILVTHCPPKDTLCDATGSGSHVGSSAVRRIVEEYQPEQVLCSHIHEAGGTKDAIGKSKIGNIGRLADGRIGILDAFDGASLELKNIK